MEANETKTKALTKSSRKAKASRENGKLSRGPVTAAGKRRSSMNAMTHGLRSDRQVVLPGEDEAEFDKLVKAVKAELKPKGPIEAALVERATAQLWRLKRVSRIEGEILLARALEHVAETAGRKAHLIEFPKRASRALIRVEQEDLEEALLTQERAEKQRDEAVLGHAFTAGANAIGTLIRYESNIERSLHKNLEQLRRLQEARKKAAP